MAIRVYQFAKARSVANKVVLDSLSQIGANITSHMAVIPDDVCSKLEAYFDAEDKAANKKLDTPKVQDIKAKDPIDSVKPNTDNHEKKIPVDAGSNINQKSVAVGPQGRINNVVQEKFTPKKRDSVKDNQESIAAVREVDLDPVVVEERVKSNVSSNLIEDLERAFSSYGRNTANYNEPSRPNKRRKFKHKKVAPRPIALVPVQSFTPTVPMPVSELSELLGRKPGELLLYFLKKGKVFALNHVLDLDQIRQLCVGLNIEVIENKTAAVSKTAETSTLRTISQVGTVTRKPVVVVMGHVDHGKTSLLDYIRKTKVAHGEHGGITQNISAYEVPVGNGIVFIDTPGHEAFSMMRDCGSKITDIALILIAADDGVMPQTAESIELAKKSGCQIMIVINKIDKPGVEKSIENIKNQLTQKYGILIEEWGGSVVCCGVSAKTGEGVDNLLEMICLQAEVLDLKAKIDVPGRAFVLESRFEKGHGAVSSLIITEGKISKFDFFVCDGKAGKIKVIEDFRGKAISQALPSTIIRVSGFDGLVSPGSMLKIVSAKEWGDIKNGKSIDSYLVDNPFAMPSKSFADSPSLQNDARIKVLIKTSTGGTLDAILKAVENAKKKNNELEKNFLLVGASAGEVSSTDVISAADFGAKIMTFATTVDRKAQELASEKNVVIEHYKIVYKLIEKIEELVKFKVENEIIYKEVGQAEVIQVFAFKGKGVVAGCKVLDGKIVRPGKVTCVRNGKTIMENKTLTSLQHLKKTVGEVKKGLECGFVTDGFDGWTIGDKVICHQAVKRGEA